MKRPLVLVGDGAFAEVAFEYFTHDSGYEVVGFAVERQFLSRDTLFGLPVVALEDVETHFAPERHSFYAAVVFTRLNRVRARFYRDMKARGYAPASYVSSRAFVWPNVVIGEHCFIFEDNTVQPFVTLGDDVVLWSGNHVGHHAAIGDHTFVSSHVVISGSCRIGRSCFLGVNATIGNDLSIGDDCLVGAGALVARDVPADTVIKGVLPAGAPGARAKFGVGDA